MLVLLFQKYSADCIYIRQRLYDRTFDRSTERTHTNFGACTKFGCAQEFWVCSSVRVRNFFAGLVDRLHGKWLYICTGDRWLRGWYIRTSSNDFCYCTSDFFQICNVSNYGKSEIKLKK